MRQLSVRDVPDDVVAQLHAEAEERHTSVNGVVCEALAAFAERRRRRKEMQQLLPAFDALSQAILQRRGGVPTTATPLLVREDRERCPLITADAAARAAFVPTLGRMLQSAEEAVAGLS